MFFADEMFPEFNSMETVEYEDVVKIIEQCNQLGLDARNMVVRHTDFNEFDNKFPCIFVYHPKQLLCALNLCDLEGGIPSKYFGAFFGNMITPGRMNLMEKMYTNGLLDHTLWTAYNIEFQYTNDISSEFKQFLDTYAPRVYVDNKYFNLNPEEIEYFSYSKATRYILDSNGYDAYLYKNSAINVLIDTCAVNRTARYTTLKVFKPIKFKKPFISTFGKDSLKFLKRIGFKTFEVVWEETYDDYSVGEEQYNCMINIMMDIVQTKSIADIVSGTQQICEYNYNLLHDTDWNRWFDKQVREKYELR
jgi:hypothetical protein